ncbi:Na+/H+ antiporter subunit E [Methanoregula sp.]|uniref:Na+/H+ antiporter subunit E n=1 Tax=Methanoregula sp. TaxID=2052170 RepID=UPI000CB4405F|nr:Na+/H+ antiporter subunit E [Methanoregula sp.]PKG33938.1 MAG: cation transporter [Methanoregula sp.]
MKGIERIISIIVTAGILFGFWILLSAHFDTFHLAAGAACAIIVALLSHDLLFTRPVRGGFFTLLHFTHYCGWLFIEIWLAGLDVAYRVLHPDLPIDPQVVTFDTPFTDDIVRTVFANSMTLTPGTITIDVSGSTYTVHALTSEAARDLTEGRSIEKRVHRIFPET